MFDTEFWCCGLSAFGNYLLVLSMDKEGTEEEDFVENSGEIDELEKTLKSALENNENDNNTNTLQKACTGMMPKLHVVEAAVTSYEIVFTTVLRTRGFEKYTLLDYHMDSMIDDLLYFIVTPKDIILAKSRDQDDHVEWLMKHE